VRFVCRSSCFLLLRSPGLTPARGSYTPIHAEASMEFLVLSSCYDAAVAKTWQAGMQVTVPYLQIADEGHANDHRVHEYEPFTATIKRVEDRAQASEYFGELHWSDQGCCQCVVEKHIQRSALLRRSFNWQSSQQHLCGLGLRQRGGDSEPVGTLCCGQRRKQRFCGHHPEACSEHKWCKLRHV
jgi:hypothetical protein